VKHTALVGIELTTFRS